MGCPEFKGPNPSRMLRARRAYHGVWLAAISCTAFLLPGCGASYQAVYEGEVRFEHCYRLDEDPGIPLMQRRECWREWTQFYTFGQTRDRLEYALRRQRELTARIENPNAVIDESETKPPVTEPLAAPAPTNPFAPPPRVHDDQTDGGSQKQAIDPAELLDMLTSGQLPPTQPCVTQCLGRWRSCTKTCDPKSNGECRKGCDASYRACGTRCFER
jgi:hypothetical protein